MPRREIRFTKRQDERLRAAAKAEGIPVPDFIRLKTLGEPPGQQRKLARRERADRERRGSAADNGSAPGPPGGPASEPSAAGLPTAEQLAERMRLPLSQAQSYLDNGMVEVVAGRTFVSGTEIP